MQKDDLEEIARKICNKTHMRFVERVGEGSFKQTFHVLDQQDTPLALKLYKTARSTTRDQREITAMLRCKHPNIARLLSVQTYHFGGQQFVGITEEFLPGGTLSSKGILSVSQCLAVGTQLVDAIAHIANLNLVHRDIKPDNIMFKADGTTPVITDFGVVRDLADSSMTPTWAPRGPGTPFFSAPEQLKNEKQLIDWRTDQFALGIVLGFVVFGEHPYRVDGASDGEVVERVSVRHQPAEWFLKHVVEYGLPSLIKMTAPWPVDRYRRPEFLRLAWGGQKG
jgi:serine/threonine protein kinase